MVIYETVMKKKRQNRQNKLIYISIIAVFALLGVSIGLFNNKLITGFSIKDIEKPKIILAVLSEEVGEDVLNLKLFDNSGITRIVVIYSVKNDDGSEKLTSVIATRVNKSLLFEKMNKEGSYYDAKLILENAAENSRIFVVVSDYENNKENKLLQLR